MELKRTITDLFPEKRQIAQLVLGIEKAIAQSFEAKYQAMANPTGREVKARFDRCIYWAEILRGDLGWGTDRICNSFTHMLSTELSGEKWEPSTRVSWVQGDGA